MKIIVYTAYYEPEKVSSLKLSSDLYEFLIRKNHEVTIYTPIPCRGLSIVEYNNNKNILYEEKFNGKLKIKRFKLFREPKNPILRLIRYLIMEFKYIIHSFGEKADIVFVQSTPPIQGILGVFIKKAKRIPFIYNLQDIFPDSLLYSGLIKNENFIFYFGYKLEKYIYANADKIITISNAMKENIINKGISANKISMIYNWVDTADVRPIEKNKNYLFEKFNLKKSDFHVLYAGNIGKAQDIDIIVDAAETLMNNEKIKIIIFGDGSEKRYYQKKTKHLLNIKWFPLQSYEEVSFVYSIADLCIITCKENFGTIAMPSKFWTILACGKPVLAYFDKGNDLEHIIKNNNIGFFCSNEDREKFVEYINYAFFNKGDLLKKSENSLKIINEKYSKLKSLEKYEKEIINVVKGEKK